MHTILKILCLITILISTQASEVFTYKFNKFLVGSGILKYKITELKAPLTKYRIESETKIFLLGALKKKVQQVSVNRYDLTPITNSYCSYPKSSLSKYPCSTFLYEENGLFSYYGMESTILNSSFSTDEYSQKIDLDIRDDFEEFQSTNKIYDMASFIMLPRYMDLETIKNDSFFIALENYRIKIKVKVSNYKKGLKKLKVLPEKNTPKEVRDQLPSFIIFDTKRKIVTQVELPSPLGKITVKLNKKESTSL